MQDFSVEGGRIGINYYYEEAQKFGVIFQKCALKLFKLGKIMEKISDKTIFRNIFIFAFGVGKIRIII